MAETTEILVKRLPHHEGLPLPTYMSEGSSGMDLVAAIDGPIQLESGNRSLIPTGISISIPTGFEGQVRPRSGLAHRHGIGLLNSPGTIDSDYRGEIKVIVINFGKEPYTIRRGDRIAQLVITSTVKATFKITEILDVTKRNEGGFGHSGL